MSTTGPPDADGKRALGPPAEPFAEGVAAAAQQQDPGLPAETAVVLARQAWALLREVDGLDAPALARALLAANPGVGATPCNVVASAAVTFCQAHDLRP